MPTQDEMPGDIVQHDGDEITEPSIIDIRQQRIDISDLPAEVQAELKADAARRMVENQDRMSRLSQDVQVLGASLREMGREGAAMAESGMTFTATNARDDDLGRTEVMIGNSEAAHRGKLTRSQAGSAGALSSHALILISIVIAAVVIIAVAMAN